MEHPVAELRIKDIDTALFNYYDKILDINCIVSPALKNSERKKVQVVFAGKERWKLSRDEEVIDIATGKIILPVIIVKREDIDRTPGVKSLGVEQPYLFVSRKLDNKTGYVQNSYKNQHFQDSDKRKYSGGVWETTTIPFPEVLTIRYKIIVWSSYIGQANEIIESIWNSLDYGLSFKIPVNNAGKEVDLENKEPSKVYVVGTLENDLVHEFNTEDYSRDERLIKYSYEVTVPAAIYTFPKSVGMSFGKNEKDGRKIVEKQYSAYKIVLKEEIE